MLLLLLVLLGPLGSAANDIAIRPAVCMQVQFYPWGIFALFADAPASRVFNSSGIAHGLSLVIGKAMVFGQTPRDIAEKRVQVYIHQTQQPYAPPLKPPDLSSIHDVIKVCPFVPPKELQAYKTEHGVNSDQVSRSCLFLFVSVPRF